MDSTPSTNQNLQAPSVPLPRRRTPPPISTSSSPPIWALTSPPADEHPYINGSFPEPQTPLPAKCAMHTDARQGVCCKDLKGEDERTLIDPDIIRDVIIGLSDGLTVPFALTAGLSSIGDSRLVVLGGFAELIAGAISMGIGGFLASQSERDHFRYLRKQTRDRVARCCGGELQREVHGVLGPVGVDEKLSRQVADSLINLEMSTRGHLEEEERTGSSLLRWWSRDKKQTDAEEDQNLRWSKDVGVTAFLLKFGEGMEEVPTARLYISAFTIGMGYFLGGLVPLLPYFFIDPAQTALIYSCIVTGIILLVFGAVKTHVTGASGGAGGYVWGAFSTLLVGGAAAGAAYGIVRALEV